MEQVLTDAHSAAGRVLGQLALALASRRGVTRARLRAWAQALREVADMVEGAGGPQ